MKAKSFFAFLLAFLVTVIACTASTVGSAVITTYTGTVSVLPGNTRSQNPDYSHAWLDTVIVRSDASAILPDELEPVDSYPYSLTYDEFVHEASQYMVLFDLDTNSVTVGFDQLIQVLYYSFTALGLTDDAGTMYDYLVEYGIDCNAGADSEQTKLMHMSIIYACLKNNAYYAVYGENITIPKGVTLEHAIVICLSQALGISLPSGVNTLSGLSLLVMRSYITDADLPVSANPDEAEAEYWAKISVAAAQDYQVPTVAFNEATGAQKEYVDYAYCASVIKLKYDITVNPLKLYEAVNNADTYAVHKLILKTMLDEKGISYSADETTQALFEKTCNNGYFELEKEFYSDIFSYNIYTDYACEKVWFSPFTLCEQLDGDLSYLTMTLNGTPIKHGATASVDFNKANSTQAVELKVTYNDGGFENDTVVYKFNLIKKSPEESTTQTENDNGSLVGTIEGFISSALPEDNIVAQQRVEEVFSGINEMMSTTHGDGVLTTYNTQTTASSSSVFTTFPSTTQAQLTTSDASTSSLFTTYPAEKTQGGIGATFAAITENPIAVATPFSLAAIGTAVGLIINSRKRKDYLRDEEEQAENYFEE